MKDFLLEGEDTKVDTIMKFSGKLLILDKNKKRMLSLSYAP